MKKVIALVLAVVMVLGCSSVAFAGASSSRSSGGGSSSIPYATTAVAKEGVHGEWAKAADGTWSCTVNGKKLTGWQLVYNSGAKAYEWYYFNAEGNMLTGWQWILDADGVTRCYYLAPTGTSAGACALNGRTMDGYTVDKNGAWTKNGVVQTK